MKLKDLHTNLKKEINLLEFHPKKEVSVDSFGIEENIIEDLSKNKIKKNLKLRQTNKILVKKINKKNNFDVLKSKNFINRDINIKGEKKINSLKLNNFNLSEFIKNKNFNTNLFVDFIKGINKYLLFFLIFLVIIFTDKFFIEQLTASAYKNIFSIKTTKKINLYEIESKINSAKNKLKIAKILFLPLNIITGERIENANYTIIGGIKTTDFLLKIIRYLEKTKNFVEKKGVNNVLFSQLLENSKNIFEYSETEITDIINIYKKIHFSDNIILQKKLDYFIEEGNKINYYISTVNNNFETFLNILGHNKRKKYLVIFQNNDEIRPQGGFMGSMGVIEIFRGQIKKFEKRDVYDYEFKIKKEHFTREIAPEGINKMTPYLGLRDSNYYINHKDSGNKIKFFIEKSGINIDGIVYINQNTLFELLDLIGEYSSKVLNTKINSSNFSIIMSSLVEAKKTKYGTLGTPKKILFDFIEEFKNKLNNKNISKIKIFEIILNNFKNREISFYNFNKEERELLEEINIFNPIKFNESLDFNYPVFTSISGNKSDRYIKTSYEKVVEKIGKCGFKTNFKIILEHTFNEKELEKNNNIFKKFGIKNNIKKLQEIQGNGINKQYIRVIIPKNTKIISNKNIISIKKYYKRGKVVDFYLNTPVGKKSSFDFSYTLENNNCNLYNYKLYKQPGIREYNLNYNKFGLKNIFKNINNDLFIN